MFRRESGYDDIVYRITDACPLSVAYELGIDTLLYYRAVLIRNIDQKHKELPLAVSGHCVRASYGLYDGLTQSFGKFIQPRAFSHRIALAVEYRYTASLNSGTSYLDSGSAGVSLDADASPPPPPHEASRSTSMAIRHAAKIFSMADERSLLICVPCEITAAEVLSVQSVSLR